LHLAREKQAELEAASELREMGHIIDELEAAPKSILHTLSVEFQRRLRGNT